MEARRDRTRSVEDRPQPTECDEPPLPITPEKGYFKNRLRSLKGNAPALVMDSRSAGSAMKMRQRFEAIRAGYQESRGMSSTLIMYFHLFLLTKMGFALVLPGFLARTPTLDLFAILPEYLPGAAAGNRIPPDSGM